MFKESEERSSIESKESETRLMNAINELREDARIDREQSEIRVIESEKRIIQAIKAKKVYSHKYTDDPTSKNKKSVLIFTIFLFITLLLVFIYVESWVYRFGSIQPYGNTIAFSYVIFTQ